MGFTVDLQDYQEALDKVAADDRAMRAAWAEQLKARTEAAQP